MPIVTRLSGRLLLVAATLLLGLIAVPAPAQNPGEAVATAQTQDLDSTISLQLKSQPIDQLVKFLGETTGKPVIYNPQEVQAQVTVTSPKPVTRREALSLIYDALLLQGIYVAEMSDQIRIVKGDAIKNLKVRNIGADEDVQALPDSNEMVQKIYKLQNIKAADLAKHLSKFVPETSMTFDPASDTVIVIDQLGRVKEYDRVVQALDSPEEGNRVTEFFKLQDTDAVEMAELLAGILQQGSGGGGGDDRSRSSYSSRYTRPTGMVYQSGEITIVPESRLNWLIVTCPPEKLDEVKRLVAELDQAQAPDIQLRIIEVKHIEANTVASNLQQLLMARRVTSDKERVDISPYEDGSRILVRSSLENFEMVQELVAQLDTPDAEKNETRTYQIKFLQAGDLAQQLEQLFEDTQSNPWYYYSRSSSSNEPKFVPMARNNALIVMAKPKDFEFIEKMVKELDMPVDPETIEPRIYQIRNTDANELVNIMETLFQQNQGRNMSFNLFRSSRSSDQSSIESIFGDIRFVVDNVTNRIVVLTSHPENYEIIDRLITKFDMYDPESSEVLVYELKYADAMDVAERLNNLFSQGAVQQQGQQNQQNRNANNQQEAEAEIIRQIFFPWQSGGQQQRPGEEVRPINTMIGNVRVVPDPRTAKLLVASPPIYFAALRNVVELLDQPEPQVNIRTRIIEMTRGNERRIGLRWTPDPDSIEPAELDNAILGLSQLGFLDAFGNEEAGPFTGNFVGNSGSTLAGKTSPGNTVLGTNVNLAILLQLLLKNSESRIVSEPNITVNNNEVGNIFVGSDFPFRQGSTNFDTGKTSDQIEYRPVGVTLNIEPHINADNEIVLSVDMENSKVRDERISGDLVTDKTTLKTELGLDSGQTMVIGGIIINDEFSIQRQVPFFGRLPLIGWLFRKNDSNKTVRELMVFITPDVLETREQEDALVKGEQDRIDEQLNKDREEE